MTAIVAVAGPRGVVIGGDSAGTDDAWGTGLHQEPKVWEAGPLVFGACGSFRVSQLLRYQLPLPVPELAVEPMAYLTGPLVDAMRQTLEAGGALTVWQEDTTEELNGSSLVVGYAGRVFEVFEDFGVGELTTGYAAVGSGAVLAYGALAATEGRRMTPAARVELALEVAERHNAAVRRPWVILEQRAPVTT